MARRYGALVIGLGAMGSAAVYQLAKRGTRVLGIDRFSPPHTMGSTHGDTRVTRQATGEGRAYVPFAMRSNHIWRDIERLTGASLYSASGGLVMGSGAATTQAGGQPTFLQQTLDCALEFHIPHTVLDTAGIRQRFPQFALSGDEVGYFEPSMGYLRPEACIEAQLGLARSLGAEVHLGEQVLSIERATDGAVVVRTALGEYEANRAVLSAGGWVSGFVPAEWKRVFQVYRQTLHWFAPARPADFKSDVFPTFIWRLPGVHGEHIYGFPLVDGTGGGVKVATAQLHTTTTPDTVDRHVTESECNLLYDTLLASRLPGLTRSSVKALACLYTVTPDEGFVIDHYPNWPEVALVSPCSGHGFKHSAAIGETVAELLTTGTTALDITPFRLQRFAGGQAGVPVPRAGGRTTMPE